MQWLWLSSTPFPPGAGPFTGTNERVWGYQHRNARLGSVFISTVFFIGGFFIGGPQEICLSFLTKSFFTCSSSEAAQSLLSCGVHGWLLLLYFSGKIKVAHLYVCPAFQTISTGGQGPYWVLWQFSTPTEEPSMQIVHSKHFTEWMNPVPLQLCSSRWREKNSFTEHLLYTGCLHLCYSIWPL